MTAPMAKFARPQVGASAASSAPFVTQRGSRDTRTAANDATVAEPSTADGNPLRIIQIGMACFFTVAAAVMALS